MITLLVSNVSSRIAFSGQSGQSEFFGSFDVAVCNGCVFKNHDTGWRASNGDLDVKIVATALSATS